MHTIHCRKLLSFKYRYEYVGNVLFDIFRWTRVYVKKKVLVIFFIHPHEGRPILRPDNVLMYVWVGGKYVCVDLTEVFSLVRLRI